jgi:hypothetical protein
MRGRDDHPLPPSQTPLAQAQNRVEAPVIRLARNIAESLRSQPLLLALVTINIAFLIGISVAVARKDALLAELIKLCVKP